MILGWLLLNACGDGTERPGSPPIAPVAAVAPVDPRGASKAASSATVALADGWGAVFWRNDQPWKVGGGDIVTSPTAAAQVVSSGDPLSCGGVAIKGAPARGALALPIGAGMPKIVKAPAIQAHIVERSAWRLDELLPPQGKYAPAATSKSPAQQRGVHVGSVAKTRRYGSPPVLIATGVRECVASVAILTASADRGLAFDQIPGICDPMRVIPATDLDGDGAREFTAYNQQHVLLYRLGATPGEVQLTRLAHWTCPIESR
jgi:hypothetical protein